MDADRARHLLTTELADLDQRARFAAESREQAMADPNQEGALGQHPADHGTEVATTMGTQQMVDTVAEQRRSVVDALARLDAGEYGRCQVCGADIDDERLAARPEAPNCREHADTPVVA